MNTSFGFSSHNHTLEDIGIMDVGAQDLADSDVFAVEFLGVFRQSLNAELGEQLSK